MTTQEFANGLRQVAAWYDEHPEATAPYGEFTIAISAPDTIEDARALARALGAADKKFSETMFTLSRPFGAVRLSFVFWRETVCTRRVVGTKLVPAQPAQPAREEAIVEWDCTPVFADREEGTADA